MQCILRISKKIMKLKPLMIYLLEKDVTILVIIGLILKKKIAFCLQCTFLLLKVLFAKKIAQNFEILKKILFQIAFHLFI